MSNTGPVIRVFSIGEDWVFSFRFLNSSGAAVAMNGSGVGYKIRFIDKKTHAVKTQVLDTAASGALALAVGGAGNNEITGKLAKATASSWGKGRFSADLIRYTSTTEKRIVPVIVSQVEDGDTDIDHSYGVIGAIIDASTFDINGPAYIINEGPPGPAPAHEISGAQIRFKNPDGTWGAWMNIAAPVLTAGTVLNPRKTWRQSTAPTYDDVFPPGVQAFPYAGLGSGFAIDASPWGVWTNAGLTLGYGADFGELDAAGVADWQLAGGHTFYAQIVGTPANGTVFDLQATMFNKTIVIGKTYEVSAYVGVHRCNVFLEMLFYRDDWSLVAEYRSLDAGYGIEFNGGAVLSDTFSGGRNLAGYRRLWVHAVAPAGATRCHVIARAQCLGLPEPYLFMTRPYFGKLPAGQITPSEGTPYEPPMWIDTSVGNQIKIYNDLLGGATWL